MATTIGTESNLIDMLESLAHLEHDAVAAYRAAVDRLDDNTLKTAMQGMLGDHENHVRELGDLLRAQGKEPPTGTDAKGMLTKGKVVMADLMGDKAILQAMKTNEDDTNTAYDRAVNHNDATPEVKAVLEKAQADEHRHKAWITETIDKL